MSNELLTKCLDFLNKHEFVHAGTYDYTECPACKEVSYHEDNCELATLRKELEARLLKIQADELSDKQELGAYLAHVFGKYYVHNNHPVRLDPSHYMLGEIPNIIDLEAAYWQQQFDSLARKCPPTSPGDIIHEFRKEGDRDKYKELI